MNQIHFKRHHRVRDDASADTLAQKRQSQLKVVRVVVDARWSPSLEYALGIERVDDAKEWEDSFKSYFIQVFTLFNEAFSLYALSTYYYSIYFQASFVRLFNGPPTGPWLCRPAPLLLSSWLILTLRNRHKLHFIIEIMPNHDP